MIVHAADCASLAGTPDVCTCGAIPRLAEELVREHLQRPADKPQARPRTVTPDDVRGVVDGHAAQRLINYWLTARTERVALAPMAPLTGSAE